ncbi:MAG: GGDEF domain-containing response regulator [Nitrospirae bacterium]|nr:GGDEF domain-containing response regulator [Candidatus Troglogloeales bacterium]
MGIPLNVLIVDHADSNASLMLVELRKGGFAPTHKRVGNAEEMRAALNSDQWDIIISAHDMPNFSALAALNVLAEHGEDIPFILVSDANREDSAVEAMKRGAQDYIMKGNLKRLLPAIERELREAAIRHERQQDEDRLYHSMHYDHVSDMPNRTLFCEQMKRAILASRRSSDPLAVLVIKLNQFQQVNNALGSIRGDNLLQQVGQRLQRCRDGSEPIAHFGGTTFAILLPEAEVEEAIRTAKRLLKETESPFMTENLPISVTGNVGVACFPEHGSDPNTLIQKADIALHAAMQSGSGYAIYQPEMDFDSYRRLLLMGRLAGIIGKETELFLQYQPQVEMKTMRVVGVEALMRWQHPEHGLILPNQFISATEQTGLIQPLTTWVLKTALQQYRAWEDLGLNITQAVNISARSLQDLEFPYHVANMIKAQKGYPEWLQIEITEGAIMANPARAMGILTQLSAMKISLSMDDFGTGYSSLGRLKDMPVDEIKIDQCFVKGMLTNEDDAAMVRSMINLFHNLGRIVLAEGVENQATWDMLASLGCDRVQGFFIARPMGGDQFPHWLKASPYHVE